MAFLLHSGLLKEAAYIRRSIVLSSWSLVRRGGSLGWAGSGLISREETLQELHKERLLLGLGAGESRPPRELLLAHAVRVIQIYLGEVDLQGIVEAVEFEELANELGAYHSRGALHDLLGIRIFPVETRLALLNLLLVVDDLKDAGAQLSSQLAQNAVGLQGLDHKVLQLVHCRCYSIY